MSLKSTFLAFKKVVQVVQIRGGGGGRGNLDKIQKNSYFLKPSLNTSYLKESAEIKMKEGGLRGCANVSI